jgi:hypothetical protein
MEKGKTLDINPIVCLCGQVAAQAIFFVVGCNLLVGSIGLEKAPNPNRRPKEAP